MCKGSSAPSGIKNVVETEGLFYHYRQGRATRKLDAL
jgi:hypothetical protein